MQHKPLVSYRINRQLSGWILPPLMNSRLRARGQCSAICTDIQIRSFAARTPKPRRVLLVFVDRRNDGQTSVWRLECEMA